MVSCKSSHKPMPFFGFLPAPTAPIGLIQTLHVISQKFLDANYLSLSRHILLVTCIHYTLTYFVYIYIYTWDDYGYDCDDDDDDDDGDDDMHM